MILTASSLTILQSCSRRFLLEADWIVLKWRAKSLLDASLRRGILALSNGTAIEDVISRAKADFLQVAANPGLDLPQGSDSYRIAMDYCGMMSTILHAATRWGVPKLTDAAAVRLNGSASWQPTAFAGGDGSLHRIVTVERWDEAAAAREMHGWATVGDTCTTGMRLIVHVIIIGSMRNGRRASPWARAWRHPSMPNLKLRFLHKDGTTFKGWIPYYLSDHSEADAADWARQMEREGATRALTHTILVDPPAEGMRAEVLRQLLMEASRAGVLLSERASTPWSAMPMSRAACDGPLIPCPFQHVCYEYTEPGAERGSISTIGLYAPRMRAKDDSKVA